MYLLLRYSDRLTQFGSKLVYMGGCINNDKAKTTTPLVTFPTLRKKKRGSSLTSPANQYRGDAGDGVYGLSYSSEKARMSNHFPMSWQKKRVFLSYLTTLSVCLIWSLNPRPSRKAVRLSTTWISQVRFFFFYHVFLLFLIFQINIGQNLI